MLTKRIIHKIDLEKYEENLNYIRKITDAKIMVVVKANAYGHGMVKISKKSEELGIDFFGVAFLEEAEELRKNDIKSDILILNYIAEENIIKVSQSDYIITLYSLEQLEKYNEILGKKLKNIKFHININTGMNRLGINIDELEKLKKYNINIEGAYSHFSNAGNDEEITEKQYQIFQKSVRKLKKMGFNIRIKHISNSAGVFQNKKYSLDYVRVGMALYGLQPLNYKLDLKPIMTIKTIVSNIRNIKKGENIGYGKNISNKNVKISIIPIGYSDGYLMSLSKKGYVLIDGKKCNIVGEVCMEQIIVDISKLKNVSIGDEVVILGQQKLAEITPEILGKLANTVPDDIVCKLGQKR
ncbi:MAG: alanine racemase [Fusobacteriia bacterium 4572_132]|nr:MAG: alanine racemase [Fusobacteriia bacterium 4572_132]